MLRKLSCLKSLTLQLSATGTLPSDPDVLSKKLEASPEPIATILMDLQNIYALPEFKTTVTEPFEKTIAKAMIDYHLKKELHPPLEKLNDIAQLFFRASIVGPIQARRYRSEKWTDTEDTVVVKLNHELNQKNLEKIKIDHLLSQLSITPSNGHRITRPLLDQTIPTYHCFYQVINQFAFFIDKMDAGATHYAEQKLFLLAKINLFISATAGYLNELHTLVTTNMLRKKHIDATYLNKLFFTQVTMLESDLNALTTHNEIKLKATSLPPLISESSSNFNVTKTSEEKKPAVSSIKKLKKVKARQVVITSSGLSDETEKPRSRKNSRTQSSLNSSPLSTSPATQETFIPLSIPFLSSTSCVSTLISSIATNSPNPSSTAGDIPATETLSISQPLTALSQTPSSIVTLPSSPVLLQTITPAESTVAAHPSPSNKQQAINKPITPPQNESSSIVINMLSDKSPRSSTSPVSQFESPSVLLALTNNLMPQPKIVLPVENKPIDLSPPSADLPNPHQNTFNKKYGLLISAILLFVAGSILFFTPLPGLSQIIGGSLIAKAGLLLGGAALLFGVTAHVILSKPEHSLFSRCLRCLRGKNKDANPLMHQSTPAPDVRPIVKPTNGLSVLPFQPDEKRPSINSQQKISPQSSLLGPTPNLFSRAPQPVLYEEKEKKSTISAGL